MSETLNSTQLMASATSAGRKRNGGRIGRIPWYTYVLLVCAVVVSMFPLYFMFVVATTDSATATTLPPRLYPGDNLFHLVGLVLETVPFIQSMINSLIVALSIGVGSALLCALAGFAFAKLEFRGRNALFILVVLTMTVPTQLSVIPQYLIISALDWVDTLQALIVPGLASAFGIFWMRQHISSSVSDELLQAARLDGANTWQITLRIKVPLIANALILILVFALIGTLQFFNEPQVLKFLAAGSIGPDFTPNMYAYQQAFALANFNYGSAISFALGAVVFVCVYIFMFLTRKRGSFLS